MCYFDNELFIVTQVLVFQSLYSVSDSNVEAGSIDFECDAQTLSSLTSCLALTCPGVL